MPVSTGWEPSPALYPEDRDLEQKVDRHKRTHGQHGQHAERPQQTAAALSPCMISACVMRRVRLGVPGR